MFLTIVIFISNRHYRDLESYLIIFLSPFSNLSHPLFTKVIKNPSEEGLGLDRLSVLINAFNLPNCLRSTFSVSEKKGSSHDVKQFAK